MSRQLKKENTYILLILIGLMLFPASGGHCKNTIKTHQKIIVIDPGHGGTDTGITTKTGLTEKSIVLTLSGYLAELLDGHYTVYLTRQDDSFIKDVDRASYANIRHADLFISIHIGNTTDNKSHFFYHMPGDEQIPDIHASDLTWQHQALKSVRQSRHLCDILLTAFSRHDANTPCFITGAPVKFLSGCQMPAIVIEPFSLKILSGLSSQEKVLKEYAHLIKNGIESYFNNK